ncbi:MAG TPA: DHH family phosphoesterase [Myxococcota bacterium]
MHGTGEPLGRYTTDLPEGALDQADAVAAVLVAAKRVLVCGNTGADGDVAGSTLALRLALLRLGKEVVVYNDEAYPDAFAWLPGGRTVVTALADDDRFDATVVVDCAKLERLGRTFPTKERRGTWCWIDHHRIDVPPGDVNYVDLTAAAVGEQIALVLDALSARVGENLLDADVGRCLYASVLTDTGGFRYGNTSARALRLAARLVEAGVDPWEMTEHIYESQDEARVRLLGRALDGLVRSSCGRLGLVQVRVSDLVELGAVEEHVQGLVNSVRAIKGVEIAALVRELGPEQSRVIFRSRGNIAITPIAVGLGGKGTKNAGSAVIGGDIDSVSDVVVAAAQAHLRTLETMAGGNAE